MKYTRFFIPVLTLLFFLFSCATAPEDSALAPEWYTQASEGDQGDCIRLKVFSRGISQAEALDDAVMQLYSGLLELSGIEDLYSRDEDRQALQASLRNIIESESVVLGDIVTLEQQEWILQEEEQLYYGLFCIWKSSSEQLESQLEEKYYSSDDELNFIKEQAAALTQSGQIYSAAEEWVKGAVYVQDNAYPLAEVLAQQYLDQAAELLTQIDIKKNSLPETALTDFKVDPFYLSCVSLEEPVPFVEFLVQYQGKKRNGEAGQFERRLVSNETGTLEFYHPFIPFSGPSAVRFLPGSREFRSDLSKLEDAGLEAESIRLWLKEMSVIHEIQVRSSSRTLDTGIVILHTDISGKALSQEDSSEGLLEVLYQDGFIVSIMNLDARELLNATEAEFLRDLRAVYADEYDRVIFGTVQIQDFEPRDDSFRVTTGGVLKLVDVESSEILKTVQIEKSVESRDNLLAVSASFRELGKSFADEWIRILE